MSHRIFWLRRTAALVLIAFSLWLWTWSGPSDVIYLIVNWKPVLFNRYSQGHLGALLVLTPILWALAAALWSRKALGQALANIGLSVTSTLVAILVVTYLAHLFHVGPRYVETDIDKSAADELELAGITRHRPPNERFELVWTDKPEHPRSYPEPPPGYGKVPIVLTSDENGFRNPRATNGAYQLVAVGDSFVAGSHVSDDQGWAELLQDELGMTLYNLGVSGSGPRIYLNNFAYYGTERSPRLALFMIYEGNDFKEDVATRPKRSERAVEPLGERIGDHFTRAFKASPVTAGLRRLSVEVFQQAGASSPVPGYEERVGFMPLRVTHQQGADFYGFAPRRLLYLNVEQDAFRASAAWKSVGEILDRMAELCQQNGIRPLFLYAPSTPHVVLPLVADAVPAEQLLHFAAYGSKRLGKREPAEFKEEVLGNLDNQERIFMDHCTERRLHCLSLTPALQRATAAGLQTYYTYDQHWTPDGNRVVADTVAEWMRGML